MTDPEMAVWRQTLQPIPVEAGLLAVRELRGVHDRTPTHHQFLIAAQDCGRRLASQHPERSLGATEPDDGSCHRCGDTGWVEVEVRSGDVAVERCRCSKGKRMNRGLDESLEHPSACSCHVCTYGVAKARAGRRPREGDPLVRVVDVEARIPYSDD
jgi:hypothetical protein